MKIHIDNMNKEYMTMMHDVLYYEIEKLRGSDGLLNRAREVALNRIFILNSNKVKKYDTKKTYKYSMDIVDSLIFLLHFNNDNFPMDMYPQLFYVINQLQTTTA